MISQDYIQTEFDFLSTEKFEKTLIICDIQDTYLECITNSFKLETFLTELYIIHSKYNKIYWYYNDYLSKKEMEKWVKNNLLNSLKFIEENSFIKRKINYFLEKIEFIPKECGALFDGFNEISDKEIYDIVLEKQKDDFIHKPHFTDKLVEICKEYNHIDICGGMKDWCLREMLYVLNAYQISYFLLEKWIYND